MVAASCAGVVLAYLTGMLVTGPFHRASGSMGAMLACTSAVVVLQTPGLRESLRAGLLRVAGTAIGALLAYLYLRLFAFSTFGMMCSVALLVTLSMLLGIPDNGRMATITLLAILLVSQQNHALAPGMNCLLRFVESALGVAIGVVLAWASSRLSPPAAAAQPVQCPPAEAVPCRPVPPRSRSGTGRGIRACACTCTCLGAHFGLRRGLRRGRREQKRDRLPAGSRSLRCAGPVSRVLSPELPPGLCHLSRAAVSCRLKQPTPRHRASNP